ncbi:MAG TPA: DEAD/DEAH box helicase [Campylobacterales bacterium]|nr:DEAD/DEAH box helicase [Campylobacterales bacterium]
MTFEDFNFKPELAKAIKDAGFKEPSPVQAEAMPIILEGKDIVAQAHTGTGKTAAFGLPVLNMMDCKSGVETVIIVPTRELATQVSDEIFRFGKYLGINTATVYGGSSYTRQINHIKKAAVIVATPGRFLDLLNKGQINISPKFVILDEADEMLDMGFLDDIKEIFTYFKGTRQALMFSATMPKPIKELATRILRTPEFVSITKKNATNENIKQHYYVVDERERDDALIRLMDYKNPTKSIVFCRTKKEVDRLSTFLLSQGQSAKGLHGDMEQRQREEVIRAFKRGSLETLIATDVAARGLDVNNVSHVFNYHIPFDSESYVHRIGRTGRAGKEGLAITIVTPHEFNSLKKIQKDVGSALEPKVIPTIKDVQMKNKDSLIDEIKNQEISELAKDLVEVLKKDFVDEDIALKLAAMLYKGNDIQGSDRIGKTTAEVSKLFERYEKGGGNSGGRNRGGRNRGYGNRGGSGRRNRSGGSGGGGRNGGRGRSNNNNRDNRR